MQVERIARVLMVGGALAAASVLSVENAQAAVLYEYDANAASPTPEPNSPAGGNFTRGGTQHTLVTETTAGNEMGTNFWRVVDNHAVAPDNAGLFYFINAAAENFTDPAGWFASTTLRVQSASNHGSGTVLEIRNAADYYGISFVNDGTNEYVGYHNALGGITKLADAELDAAYVTVDAAYDPATTLVNVFLDGGLIGTISKADAPNTGINRFGFGSNTSTATQDVYWAGAQFNTGAIPEPASLGLCAVAGLALLARRRRSDTAR